MRHKYCKELIFSRELFGIEHLIIGNSGVYYTFPLYDSLRPSSQVNYDAFYFRADDWGRGRH